MVVVDLNEFTVDGVSVVDLAATSRQQARKTATRLSNSFAERRTSSMSSLLICFGFVVCYHPAISQYYPTVMAAAFHNTSPGLPISTI